MSNESPIPVIYVVGYGRSGSTVLDIVLGGHPEVGAFGELAHLPVLGWERGEYCACGVPGTECPFWTSVRDRWSQRVGSDDVAGYAALQRRYERFRHVPKVAFATRAPDTEFAEYERRTVALYAAIRDVAGCRVIVDSSKNPARAFMLSRMQGLEPYLVHLVRDGRGVGWSLRKPYKKDLAAGVQQDMLGKSVARTAVRWTIANLQSEWIRRLSGRGHHLMVRYEDFVTNPRVCLGRIGELVGLDYGDVVNRLDQGEINPGHTIAGNRLRMRGSVRLRLDNEWRKSMSLGERQLFWIMCGPMLKYYGYKRK